NDVEISEAGQAKRLAQAMAAGAFDVEQETGRARQLHAGIKRKHSRGCILSLGSEALRTGVFGRESRVPLQDHVDLPRDPEAVVVGMPRHRVLFVLAWRSRVLRLIGLRG